MLAIKASIWDYDRKCHSDLADRYVINTVDPAIHPLFTPEEMAAISSRLTTGSSMPSYRTI